MTKENKQTPKENKQVPKENKREIDKKKFVVVESFTDLQNDNKKYKKGDVFNTEGSTVKRIDELSTRKNKRNRVIIKEQE